MWYLLINYLNPLSLKHSPENKNLMKAAHFSLMDYLFTVVPQVFGLFHKRFFTFCHFRHHGHCALRLGYGLGVVVSANS